MLFSGAYDVREISHDPCSVAREHLDAGHLLPKQTVPNTMAHSDSFTGYSRVLLQPLFTVDSRALGEEIRQTWARPNTAGIADYVILPDDDPAGPLSIEVYTFPPYGTRVPASDEPAGNVC